ncbi:MAG: hypothetical protein JWQ43_1462 [Glaciihabitans sp.]|nr:hypothetical protein [Glaciihabitans sp.]
MSEPTNHQDRPDRPPRPPRDNDRRPARDDAPRRDAAPRSGDRDSRPARSNDRDSRPARSGDRDARPARTGDRDARPARSSDRRPGTGQKLWTDGGSPARNNSDAGARNAAAAADWEDRDPFNTRAVRSRHDEPVMPEDVDPGELDRVARNELKTLSKENAEGVAKHLVMAARLIESDPAEAHRHAISAARRAGRIGMVRETLAITAYTTGDFALALRELRTHRRITGTDTQLPLMVDTLRALERPVDALELARSVAKSSLPVSTQVELAIAISGARLDMGKPEQALMELDIPQLNATRISDYSPALFAAYATTLEELGRESEAEKWWTLADTAQEALDRHYDGDDGETIDIIEDEMIIDEDLLGGLEDDVDVVDEHEAAIAEEFDKNEAMNEDAQSDEDTNEDVEDDADEIVSNEESRAEETVGDANGGEEIIDEAGEIAPDER